MGDEVSIADSQASPIKATKPKKEIKKATVINKKAEQAERHRLEMEEHVARYVSIPKTTQVWQICMTEQNVILLTSIFQTLYKI